jgi:hypothetical protein
VSKPQVFGLGYMLGALIAITAALGAIAHETRRADARKHKVEPMVFGWPEEDVITIADILGPHAPEAT